MGIAAAATPQLEAAPPPNRHNERVGHQPRLSAVAVDERLNE